MAILAMLVAAVSDRRSAVGTPPLRLRDGGCILRKETRGKPNGSDKLSFKICIILQNEHRFDVNVEN